MAIPKEALLDATKPGAAAATAAAATPMALLAAQAANRVELELVCRAKAQLEISKELLDEEERDLDLEQEVVVLKAQLQGEVRRTVELTERARQAERALELALQELGELRSNAHRAANDCAVQTQRAREAEQTLLRKQSELENLQRMSEQRSTALEEKLEVQGEELRAEAATAKSVRHQLTSCQLTVERLEGENNALKMELKAAKADLKSCKDEQARNLEELASKEYSQVPLLHEISRRRKSSSFDIDAAGGLGSNRTSMSACAADADEGQAAEQARQPSEQQAPSAELAVQINLDAETIFQGSYAMVIAPACMLTPLRLLFHPSMTFLDEEGFPLPAVEVKEGSLLLGPEGVAEVLQVDRDVESECELAVVTMSEVGLSVLSGTKVLVSKVEGERSSAPLTAMDARELCAGKHRLAVRSAPDARQDSVCVQSVGLRLQRSRLLSLELGQSGRVVFALAERLGAAMLSNAASTARSPKPKLLSPKLRASARMANDASLKPQKERKLAGWK